jgi:hypothetical protein
MSSPETDSRSGTGGTAALLPPGLDNGDARLSALVHGAWFVAVFGIGVWFLNTLPPLHGNDESAHWVRMWAVAQGHVRCTTVPRAVTEINDAVAWRWPDGVPYSKPAMIGLGHAFRGDRFPSGGWTHECVYFPAAYVAPAVVARVLALDGHDAPVKGGMFRAVYAARFTNWLIFSLALLLGMRLLPWARAYLLFFYSIPEVIQQASVISSDGLVLSLSVVLLALVCGRPAWWKLWTSGAVVAVLSATKAVHAGLGLMALPMALELQPLRRWRVPQWAAVAATGLLPYVAWKAWSGYIEFDKHRWVPPWNVDPARQIDFLKAHPSHVLTLAWVQLKMTFSHDLMKGSWTSILGGFANSSFEMPMIGYWLLLFALVAAFASDAFQSAQPALRAGGRLQRAAWALALTAILVIIPASVFAMYLLFSSVGAGDILGVQGRYYLVPLFLTIGLALFALKLRRRVQPAPQRSVLLAISAALACVVADVIAVRAVHAHYYLP